MNNPLKDKVRPIYTELQGYLSQAPELRLPSDTSRDESLWNNFHKTLDELHELTDNDYDKFKIPLTQSSSGEYHYMDISSYRSNLGGLINRLYGECFSDEISPLGGVPNTIIQQTQSQSQTTLIQVVLDISSKIEKRLLETQSKAEKSFLEKLKAQLPNITSAVQALGMILNLANQAGVDISTLHKIFS